MRDMKLKSRDYVISILINVSFLMGYIERV